MLSKVRKFTHFIQDNDTKFWVWVMIVPLMVVLFSLIALGVFVGNDSVISFFNGLVVAAPVFSLFGLTVYLVFSGLETYGLLGTESKSS